MTIKDGEAVPDPSERSELFELVPPLSISAVNGDGEPSRPCAHAWWTGFSGLDPRFSASQTDPQCAHELEQELRLVVKLSEATFPQVQSKPMRPQLDVIEEDDEFEEFPASDECAMCWYLVPLLWK